MENPTGILVEQCGDLDDQRGVVAAGWLIVNAGLVARAATAGTPA